MGTTVIDCDYLHPRFAAAYLLTENSGDQPRAAFIDNNTAHAVPRLLAELTHQGLKPSDVDFVIITHVHLDHASGSSALMAACPRAKLICHPRAAPHMIDPSRLNASARQVYGEEKFHQLYGEPEPIEVSRVQTLEDGETLPWGKRPLKFLHTRGHANHHFCIEDATRHAIFTGDAFGLAYPDLQANGLFIFPSTSPTDFDGTEARRSIDRIVATHSKTAWLTHFGAVTDLASAREQLLAHLDFSEALLEQAIHSPLGDPQLDGFCQERLTGFMKTCLEKHGLVFDTATRELLALDLELNGQGLAHVARKRRGRMRTG